MSRIISGILFIILCGVFFEAGLVLSDTIVTGQSPHISQLLSSQLDEITGLIDHIHHSKVQPSLTVDNQNDVINVIQNKTGLDGINLATLQATTNESTTSITSTNGVNNAPINVTITVTGYKTSTNGNNTNGSIVITPNATYTITATATATSDNNGGYEVDLNSIIITSMSQQYNNNSS